MAVFDVSSGAARGYDGDVERVVHKARNFREADEWEVRQQRAMSPEERMRAAREIKDRLFPGKQPDVREWHRRNKGE